MRRAFVASALGLALALTFGCGQGPTPPAVGSGTGDTPFDGTPRINQGGDTSYVVLSCPKCRRSKCDCCPCGNGKDCAQK